MDVPDLQRNIKELPEAPWQKRRQGDYWQIVSSTGEILAIIVCPKDSAAERLAWLLTHLHDIEEPVDLDAEMVNFKNEVAPLVDQLKENFGNVCPEIFEQLGKYLD